MLAPPVARDLFSQPLEIDKGMLQYQSFLVITHGASQLSKLTRVVNNVSVMTVLFELIKNRDFEGETSK